eukprot:202809_1
MITYVLYIATIVHSAWVAPEVVIPSALWESAVGYYKNSIFLIGGHGNSNSNGLIEFDTITETFTDHTPGYKKAFSDDMNGDGQYYSQLGNNVFMINHIGNKYHPDTIAVFNLETKKLDSHWKSIDLQQNVGETACLMVTDDNLFVVGGGTTLKPLKTTQILDLESYLWLTHTPSMKTTRRYLACVVDHCTKTIYAISGNSLCTACSGAQKYHQKIKSIEKLNINDMDNIQNEIWDYMPNELPYPALWGRAVLYGKYIFVIGFDLDKPQIINTETGKISLGDTLPYEVRSTSMIIVNHILYVFGGFGSTDDDSNSLDRWIYWNFGYALNSSNDITMLGVHVNNTFSLYKKRFSCPESCSFGSDCIYTCDYNVCSDLIFDVGNGVTFYLLCNNEDNPCSNIYIDAQFAKSVQIECIGDNITVCSNMIILATFVEEYITFQSIGDLASDNITIHARHAKDIQVIAEGNGAFIKSTIFGENASKLTVSCFNLFHDKISSCFETKMFLSSNERSNKLICKYGCNHISVYFKNDIDIDLFSDIVFKECPGCPYIEDCIDKWYLYYDGYNESTIYYKGGNIMKINQSLLSFALYVNQSFVCSNSLLLDEFVGSATIFVSVALRIVFAILILLTLFDGTIHALKLFKKKK